MDEDPLTVTDQPRREDVELLGQQLHLFNESVAGPAGYRPLFVAVRDDGGELVGGLFGVTWWGSLHLQMLWVAESQRRHGLGSRLLAAAEREAVARGARRVLVSTSHPQAVRFYRRCGYEVFAELPDCPPGCRHSWLVKQLPDALEGQP